MKKIQINKPDIDKVEGYLDRNPNVSKIIIGVATVIAIVSMMWIWGWL